MELTATNDKEASKLFGLFLYHKGYVQWLAEGINPVVVTVKSSTVYSTYNIWRDKEKMYAEATCYKHVSTGYFN
jgi:hypothetical protein